MEIYKDLSSPASQQFEKLLNTQLSKNKIEEGKIIEGKITKITEKYVFLFIEGLKSEAVIDINEMKVIGMQDKIEVGSKVEVLLEKIEDRWGNVVVSAHKAMKIKGWESLVECHKKGELIECKYLQKTKGGMIVEHVKSKTLCFLPGSQISDSPLKNIDHLIGEVHKMALVKLDLIRGNSVVSRRQVLNSNKKGDKKKIIDQFKIGDIIPAEKCKCKGFSSFGVFFEVDTPEGTLDTLTHVQEVSYSRVSNVQEIFSIGDQVKLKIISICYEKLQVGTSIKQLLPDPFEKISNYKVGSKEKFKAVKIVEYGVFCEFLDLPGLTTLLHSSEIDWLRKNIDPKKVIKVGDIFECVIQEIDTTKKRVAISKKMAIPNPYEVFAKDFPVGSDCNGIVESKNDYALFIRLENSKIDGFCHANDIDYFGKPEENLKKINKNDKIKVRILEINIDDQKLRVGAKQLKIDPLNYFKEKSVGNTITVKVISSDSKGLMVKPEGYEGSEILIKKSQIAVAAQDSRPSRFLNGDRIDVAISELNLEKRKVSLSIKLLEELQNKKALEMGSNPLSGRQLPFSSLSDKLDDKKKDKK